MTANWQDVEQTLDELASYAADHPASVAYHDRLLKAAIELSTAAAGAVWLFDGRGSLQPSSQHGQDLLTEACPSDQHNQWLTDTIHLGKAQTTRTTAPATGVPSNGARDYRLTLCPIHSGSAPVGVLEVLHDGDRQADHRVEQLLVAISELAAEYHRQRQVDSLRETVETSEALHQFALGIQKSLDLPSTAFQIANDARTVLRCDRVSVLTVRGDRCELLAVSGVERVNTRVETTVCLQKLGNAVRHSDQPLWYGDGESSAEFSAMLDEYADRSHARRVALLPLRFIADADTEAEVCGVLVLEQMEGHWPQDLSAKATIVARHSGAALYRAREFGTLPLLSVSRMLRRLGWIFTPAGRPRALAILAAVAAVVLALTLIPAELKVRARGQVQPTQRARIFAPYDAEVESVAVADGKVVATGAPLLTLRSPSLEAERDEVMAKLEAAAARLKIIDIETAIQNDNEKIRQAQLAAERKEVEALQRIHTQRKQELEKKLAKLNIHSPISGQVLSWMVESVLANRPVIRGQHLLTVGDVSGAWSLELDVNDFHMRHVYAASSPVTVEFALESLPGKTFTGVVRQVEPAANVDENQRSMVRVLVDIKSPSSELRPGATAVARVHCGRTSLGHAWFHDLIDAVRHWVW